MRRVDSLEKTLMLGGIGGKRRRGRDDVPQEAITKELSRHESRNQQAIIMDLALHLKLTQHCKSIILQLKKQKRKATAYDTWTDRLGHRTWLRARMQGDQQ